MKIFIGAIFLLALSARLYAVTGCDDVNKDYKYIIISMNAGSGDADIKKIASLFPQGKDTKIIVGIGTIISYLSTPPEETVKKLKNFLSLAEQNNLPVVIELDGINWWQARPDLWNWWNKSKPGYNPDNKQNVEWTDWTPDSAVKIGWRNWGRQLRVDPMPNLMSPDYLEASHTEVKRLIPVILDWWHELPAEKKNLLVSVQIGVECSIGANNWYYPNGNNLADKPEKDDPRYGLNHDILPGRGVQAIGYAAVSTLGLAKSGELKEEHVTKAVYKYVFDLCKIASDLGVPRDHLFTHAGGWKEGESVYFAGLNPYSCPGWSFYTFAKDPAKDMTAMEAVAKSDAPYWGAVEWLLFNVKEQADWEVAYHNIFAIPRLRYVQVRHWGSIKNNPFAIQAIQNVIKEQEPKLFSK
jgi:hypothetical protein